MKKLTDTQANVLAFVKAYFKEHGYAPSRREISDNFEWKSATAAQDHLRAIERKGFIRFDTRAHRNIVLL